MRCSKCVRLSLASCIGRLVIGTDYGLRRLPQPAPPLPPDVVCRADRFQWTGGWLLQPEFQSSGQQEQCHSRNFDAKANQFSLNMAKFTMEHTADPVGFKFELAAGRAMEIFHATEPAGLEVYKHLFQAYVSLKPAKWKGFPVDFGKFVTSAGAEVTETHLNWNYSRSLLYANGPYYHFGVRTSMPLGKNWTAGVQLVNGWNNVEDNNSAKTVGLTTAFTSSKFTWFNNYYFGNEKTDTVEGVKIAPRGCGISMTPSSASIRTARVSGLFNFDYGVDKNPGGRDNEFYGYLCCAARARWSRQFAVSPRYDWYKDRDGFITGRRQTCRSSP